MSTVGSFLQSMRRECGDIQPDPVLSVDWLQGRYAEVLERAPFQFLQKEATVATVAAVDTGTVTVTNNSTTVTETTTDANGWSSALAGYYFRRQADSNFYSIASYSNANPDTITLDRAYAGETGTVQSYNIWKRFYSLASDVRHVVDVYSGTMRLEEVSSSDLNISFPNRPEVGEAKVWANSGRDSSNLMQIELYPAPDELGILYYRYIQATPTLTDASITLLPQVPPALLRAGWLADYWSWRGASGDDSSITLKLARAQTFETEFQKRVTEMVTRECLAISPKRVRFAPRLVRHRLMTKFDNGSSNRSMP